jgi:hypothetical protein
MSIKWLLILALLVGSLLWAADTYTPLDVKTGQWETTTSTEMSGSPPIPPELLDRLTPEQRAKMEAVLKGRSGQGPKTITTKGCLKKEDLERPSILFGDATQRACRTTVVSSSRTKGEFRVDCALNQMKVTGTGQVEASNSENVKMTVHETMSGGAAPTNITMTSTSKWLGPACSESK